MNKIIYPLISGIGIYLLGTILELLIFSDDRIEGMDRLYVVCGIVLFLVVVVVLLVIIHLTRALNRVADRESEKLIAGISSDGLVLIEKEAAFELAAKEIIKTNVFRVTGNIQQDEFDESQLPAYIVNYMKKTEYRLKKSAKRQKFKYKRITTQSIGPYLKKHLGTCLDRAAQYKHNFGIYLSDDFNYEHTFMIFDDRLIILNLNAVISGGKEQELCLYSTDQRVIKRYRVKFDKAYRGGEAIKTSTGFTEKMIACARGECYDNSALNDLKVKTKLGELRYLFERISNESIIKLHAYSELKQFTQRLGGFVDWDINIRHYKNNSNLDQIFYHYIRRLTTGDQYRAISVNEFFRNIKDHEYFLEANRIALLAGASIHRIFIVDNHRLFNDDLYKKSMVNLLRRHHTLSEAYSNYQFNIYFTSQYEQYKQEQLSFGIWTKKSEHVIFRPDHNGEGDRIYQTKLIIVNTKDKEHPVYSKHLHLLRTYRAYFDEMVAKATSQTLNPTQREFLDRLFGGNQRGGHSQQTS